MGKANGIDQPHIAILDAGVSGMCMGIQLKKAGIDNFTIYEKAGRVGGTWRDNIYPSIACDVPSHMYSFSFSATPIGLFPRLGNPSPLRNNRREIWHHAAY